VFKYNYNPGGTLVSDEAADIALPAREWELLHDNVMLDKTIVVRTSTGGTGITLTDFTTQVGSKPWKTKLVFGGTVSAGTYFITYHTQGDQNDADDLNTLASSVNNLVTNIAPFQDIQTDLNTIQQSINQVESEVNTASGLQQTVNSIQNAVNNISSVHSTILNAITDLKTDVDTNVAKKSATDSMQSTINSIQASVDSMKTTVNQIPSMQSTINNVQTTVNQIPAIQTDIDSVHSAVTSLQTSITNISTVQTTIVNSLSDLNNKVQSLIDTGGIGGTPANTAPNISSAFSKTTALTTDIISIPYIVYDAEGGTLTASYTKDGVVTTTSVATGANTWNVGTLSAGSHTLTISVVDTGSMVSNTLSFIIAVTTPNTAPTITSSYNTTSAMTTTSISIPYTVIDTEGGVLTATYTKDGVSSTTSVSTGSNTWNVGTLSAGNHTLTIQVKDNGNLTSNTLTYNMTVSASAPSISSAYTPVSVSNLTDISIPYTITDADYNTFTATYTIDSSSTTQTVSTASSNTVTWNVGKLTAGNHTLSIQVKDGGNVTSNTLTYNISITAAPPVIVWTYDFVIPAGTPSYNLKTDPNFTYTLTNNDIYGQNLDGVGNTGHLYELGIVDGTKDAQQELPRDGIDTFTAPSMHGGYQYDGSSEVIYFDSMAMSDYYFRIVKYSS
jgi:archaellum component FlaC